MGERHDSTDWYDLPAYYDLVFERLTDDEADFLDALAKEYVSGRKQRVLEPACGSGRLLEALAARGYDVAGFDASQAMVDYARERLVGRDLPVDVSLQRMESFRYRRKFDLAHCMVSSFKYLQTEADAVAHLRSMARAVRPGGVYAIGFHLTQYEDQAVDNERWVGRRNGTKVVCTIRSSPPDKKTRLEHLRSRLAVHTAVGVRRFETHWSFRTYSAPQFRRLVRSVPEWKLVGCHDFDYDLNRKTVMGRDRLDTVAVLARV